MVIVGQKEEKFVVSVHNDSSLKSSQVLLVTIIDSTFVETGFCYFKMFKHNSWMIYGT